MEIIVIGVVRGFGLVFIIYLFFCLLFCFDYIVFKCMIVKVSRSCKR